MRLRRVVARAALIASLALIIVPGAAGSRIPSAPAAIDPSAFRAVGAARSETSMTTPQLDPISASDGSLAADSSLAEPRPAPAAALVPRPVAPLPVTSPVVSVLWNLDNNISWYGPGLYGHNGACGMMPGGMTADTVGVAHRTLPCGTKVTFRYNGRTVTTRVIDRGPYVSGRTWDMTHGLCALLGHCFTGGGVYWHLG